jgi:uncharacterized protein YjdB
VDENGKIIALREGSATIMASASGGASAACSVTVSPSEPATSAGGFDYTLIACAAIIALLAVATFVVILRRRST